MSEYSLKTLTDKLTTEIGKKQNKGNYVLKINGSTPNSNGEITITTGNNEAILEAARSVTDVETDASIAEINALQTAVARVESNMSGVVRSVNGRTPDINGSISLSSLGGGTGFPTANTTIVSFEFTGSKTTSYGTYTVPCDALVYLPFDTTSSGNDLSKATSITYTIGDKTFKPLSYVSEFTIPPDNGDDDEYTVNVMDYAGIYVTVTNGTVITCNADCYYTRHGAHYYTL